MPKAKTGNFTLRKIATAIPAQSAAHRFAALQRSGQYSELRFIQRGKSSFDIVGYRWPDKGVRRKLGIGGARKNPFEYRAGDRVSMRHVDGLGKIHWIDAEILSRTAYDAQQKPVYRCRYELGGKFFEKTCFHSDLADDWPDMKRPNPSAVGAATPNQVKFGLRGKTVVGWINKETPTKYQLSYKVGAQLAHVWRKKSAVKFVLTGKRGRVKNNCPKTAENPAGTSRAGALELSKKFHGFDPRKIHSVNIDWPKHLMLIGPCVRIDYYSKKFDGKGRVYYHDFEKPCVVMAGASPQRDGTNLLVIKGNFEIKPEGITG